MGAIDGAIGAGAGAILGLALEGHNDKRQIKQQGKLQEQQIQGQMKMADYNQEKAMEMWKNTNYSAQREQMEKAGLNVGLMYGQGGGGGTTTQSNAGNITGGTAQAQSGESIQGMGIALQAGMMQAQTELMKAQAEKTKAETIETEQRTPTHAKGMEKTDAEIQEIASKIGVNEETVRNILEQEARTQAETTRTTTLTPLEAGQLKAQTGKTEAETNKINILTPLEAELNKANIKLNNQQRERIGAEIYKIKTELDQKDIQLQQQDKKLSQEEWKIRNEVTKIKIDKILREAGINLQNKAINAQIGKSLLDVLNPKTTTIHNY